MPKTLKLLLLKYQGFATLHIIIFCIQGYGFTEQTFPITINKTTIHVYIAQNEPALSLGLMFKKALPNNEGMLFIFPKADHQRFWMKNTKIPLDVAMISSDWIIEEIYALQPFDKTIITSKLKNIHYALEVNQGFFHKHKIKPGDAIALDTVTKLLNQIKKED